MWILVENENQVKVGSILKIEGKNPRDSYDKITVKNIIDIGTSREVIINREKNYYFNITSYITGKPKMWGSWVKKLYVYQSNNIAEIQDMNEQLIKDHIKLEEENRKLRKYAEWLWCYCETRLLECDYCDLCESHAGENNYCECMKELNEELGFE